MDDIKFIGRCIELAGRAQGFTYPNPVVGCVIVHDGVIIGEGYHLKAGGPHAEEIAISCVKNRDLLGSSVLYVNLEPCSHFGRRPPCADLIISSGIRKIVIGTADTSSKVSGKGILKLKNAGCEVVTGVLEQKCRWLNRRFFTFNEKRRPYIILKWAQSIDGYIDRKRNIKKDMNPSRITGKAERVLVHKWRAEEQSILVGAGTVRADNPELTVRDWSGNNPLRLVLSRSGNLGKNKPVFRTNGTNIVFINSGYAKIPGSDVVKLENDRESSLQIAEYLFNSDIQSMIVEGGAEVLSHFIYNSLWDEARIFYGNDPLGEGVKAPEIKGRVISQSKLISSSLKVILNESV